MTRRLLAPNRPPNVVPAQDKSGSDASQTRSHPPLNKIDTHHHFVPDFYAKAVEEAGGDPSGWPTPQWSLSKSENMMSQLGVKTAILSGTAPGATVLTGEASFKLARKLNVHAASIRDAHPDKFGFFANLPSLLDTEAALEELKYALDELHADGVVLFTRYNDFANINSYIYLGNSRIHLIWEELNRRKCLVFVHPTHPVDLHKVNKNIPQPVIDYPHETTRAATDMLLQGTLIKYPSCKVILSHAGGTLPYLISRITTPLDDRRRHAVQKAFRSFYFDLALSTDPAVLRMLLELVPHDHILYGSDYPYAPPSAYLAFLKNLEDFDMPKHLRDKINFGNALDLFPRLKNTNASL